ncbi:MAG: glutamine-hydrolyzing GMP synthase [Nitrososphaerota archaeon]|nr:glutamine-hydrolyzing GMP synthase [Nitrososphaerota archaeon]
MHDTGSLEKILVLDFGAQYAHLICRRIRELGVYAELVPFDVTPDEIRTRHARGLILSGGPMSVYDDGAPLPDPSIYSIGIPILGICYGLQAMVHQNGGKIRRSNKREYGKAELKPETDSPLFAGVQQKTVCWMSHGDAAESIPEGFQSVASTQNSKYAAISSNSLYAVQFHPEVTQTDEGMRMLSNFVFNICRCEKNWTTSKMIEEQVSELRSRIGPKERVLCALSGGIDSATTAELLQRAIGDRLYCVFVDNGLLRKDERNQIEVAFRPKLGRNLIVADESRRFLSKLRGVRDPEKKRKIVGREFIRAFSDVSRKIGNVKWLAQGTLYTDIVESAAGASKHQSRIKSHHNVGGLPKKLRFKLVEPLKDLYKDEVRKVAEALGLPKELVFTHPFPGPGLSVRIIGEVTKDKLRICRDASYIVEEELRTAGLHESVWQAYAAVGDDLATGVLGDLRKVGHIVIIRIVESKEAMTADWARTPYPILERMSSRITNEVSGVTWVTYAISSKPPSTIEPQ